MVRLYKIGFKNIYIYNAHRCSRTRTKKCRRRTWRASRDTRTHLRRQRKSQCDSHFDTSGLSSTAKCSSTLRWRTARIENARFTNTRQNTKNDKKQRLLLATAQRTALEHASPPPLPANSFRAHRASSQSGKQRQGLPTRHAACAYCCNCAKKKPQQHKPKQKPLKTKHTKQHADNRKTKHSASIGGTACSNTSDTATNVPRSNTTRRSHQRAIHRLRNGRRIVGRRRRIVSIYSRSCCSGSRCCVICGLCACQQEVRQKTQHCAKCRCVAAAARAQVEVAVKRRRRRRRNTRRRRTQRRTRSTRWAVHCSSWASWWPDQRFCNSLGRRVSSTVVK